MTKKNSRELKVVLSTGEITLPKGEAVEKKLTRFDQIRAVQKHIDELEQELEAKKDVVKETRGALKQQKHFLYKLINEDPLEELDFDGAE